MKDDDITRAPEFPIPETPKKRRTRAEKVALMREWSHKVEEARPMLASAMKRTGCASLDELAERHPKQFNALLEAIEVMETELDEPEFPWPT